MRWGESTPSRCTGASVYLRDSRTILSDPSGTNPVARTGFMPGVSGTVIFTLAADDRDVADIAGAVVEVKDPFGGTDTYPLVQTIITSRQSTFSASIPVSPWPSTRNSFPGRW